MTIRVSYKKLLEVKASDEDPAMENSSGWRGASALVVAAAFFSLFGIVGFAYYGLPFFYDFMTGEYGWSRTIVTSGNALGKLLVGPAFGFIAGWMIDRYGPRRLMASGALMMGVALIGLSFANSLGLFYLFYLFTPSVMSAAVRFPAKC